jgi:hypothetical protein
VKNLDEYPWSSHRGYISRSSNWKWLYKDMVLEMLAGRPEGREKAYQRYASLGDEPELQRIYSKERWPAVLGSEKFIAGIKGRFFSKKADQEIPQSKELAPETEMIVGIIAKYYGVDRGDIVHSRRGHFNEARNVAIYLVRKLRGDTLKEIGKGFGMDQYSTVSSVVERMKALVKNDKRLEKRINHLLSVIAKSQEQT